jgi:Tol biopolymer transport system component
MKPLALVVVAFLGVALTACGGLVKRPITSTDTSIELEQVTRGSDNEFNPAISPDGKSLAFTVARTPESPMRIAVTTLHNPAQPTYFSKDVLGRDATWMPDGSGIVFVAKNAKTSREKIVQTFGQNENRPVFLADVGDPFFTGSRPSVAPNGKLVAVAMTDVSQRDSTWPTTKRIEHGIGLTDLGGTGIELFGSGTDPAWSPDGTRIAFVRGKHLFVANADGSSPTQITDGPADDQTPSWSPDGKEIVFCSAHGEEELVQANLFVVHADGTGMVQLTEGDRISCHPTWSRDGYVYFHANEGGRFHIWRVRVKHEAPAEN